VYPVGLHIYTAMRNQDKQTILKLHEL
jgi:hypothetical protein